MPDLQPQTKTQDLDRVRAKLGCQTTRALVLGVTALGAVLRLIFLGKKSLWLDEIFSVSIAKLDGPGFRNVVLSWEGFMGLYYALLRAWIKLGDSEFIVRLLSVLPAVATVPLVYSIGKRLAGKNVGMIAALLLTINAFHIRYSQEARSYSLYVFFVVLACWFYLRLLELPDRRVDALGFVFANILAIYAHFFAVLMLPVFWLATSLTREPRLSPKRLRMSTAAIFLGVLPLFLFAILKNKGQRNWIPKVGWDEIYNLAILLSGHSGAILLVLTTACLVVAGVMGARSWQDENLRERWGEWFLWLWLALPITAAAAISTVKPMFVSRYFLLCLPPFLLLVALGISRIRSRWLSITLLIGITGLSVRGDVAYYRTGFDPPDQRWRDAVHFLLSQSQSGDAVLFYHPLARLAYEYYRPRFPQYSAPVVVFPARSDARLLKGTPVDAALLRELPSRYQRVWLVQNYGPDEFTAEMQEVFQTHYRAENEREFGTTRIVLFELNDRE